MASSLDILYEAHAEYESGGGKELPELISLVDTVFPQKGEQHAAWLQHFGLLGEAWREYHREGNMSTEWPKPPPRSFPGTVSLVSAAQNTSPAVDSVKVNNTLQLDAAQSNKRALDTEERGKIRAERLAELNGAVGVGPARAPKTKQLSDKAGGRPWDRALDSFVITSFESNSKSTVAPAVYCIACDARTAGRERKRILAHARKCQILKEHWRELYNLAQENSAESSTSALLDAGNEVALPGVRKEKERDERQPHKDGKIDTLLMKAKLTAPEQARIDLAMSLRPLVFWEDLGTDDRCQALARVAIKIFSIIPSEICDERTASRLGWFNAARRASMLPEHLVDSAALYDFYTFGFDDQRYEDLPPVFVKNPDVAAAAAADEVPQVRSAPTLMDLLNPDPGLQDDAVAQEQTWFNHPDPYDLNEADRVVPHQTMVVRTSIRFAVTDFISLDSPALTALIKANGQVAPRDRTKAHATFVDLGTPGEYNPHELLDI